MGNNSGFKEGDVWVKKKRSMIRMATHVPLLVQVFEISEGDVLEMGTGYFSTLILRWLCEMHDRTLYSFESNKGWYDRAMKKPKPFQKLTYVENWDDADIEREWGMAFIDHGPNHRRQHEIKRLANYAEYIVIHDTEPESEKSYHYSNIWDLFRSRYDYKKCLPWTSVVSNFNDLSDL